MKNRTLPSIVNNGCTRQRFFFKVFCGCRRKKACRVFCIFYIFCIFNVIFNEYHPFSRMPCFLVYPFSGNELKTGVYNSAHFSRTGACIHTAGGKMSAGGVRACSSLPLFSNSEAPAKRPQTAPAEGMHQVFTFAYFFRTRFWGRRTAPWRRRAHKNPLRLSLSGLQPRFGSKATRTKNVLPPERD